MFADQRIVGEGGDQLLSVFQFADFAAGVGEDHLFETVIRIGVADDRGEGRDAGAGGEEVEALARREGVVDEGARGLAAKQHGVARLDRLQLRGEGAVGNLDREKFELLVPARAGDRVGAQERLSVRAFEADHHELARAEAERARTGDPEGEHAVGVVLHRQDGFVGRRVRGPGRLFGGLRHGVLGGVLGGSSRVPSGPWRAHAAHGVDLGGQGAECN